MRRYVIYSQISGLPVTATFTRAGAIRWCNRHGFPSMYLIRYER